jgi:hypothetical protein
MSAVDVSDATAKVAAASIAKSKGPAAPELLVLLLSYGMSGSELAATLDRLKNESKSISSHKRRQLFWEAYSAMIAKTTSMDGASHCWLKFSALPDGDATDGEVEICDLTKRQKGLLNGQCEILGHKLKPSGPDGKPDPTSKNWCIAFSEEECQPAWDDITDGEPCIYVAADGVYVATRYKRALCKGLSAPLKTAKEVEALVAELQPDKPIKSIAFAGNDPPSCNSYNTFVVGPSKAEGLPSSIGHCPSTSPNEIYDHFLQRRNGHLLEQAAKLLGTMMADTSKALTSQVYAASQKECVVAYKNALMKRIFIHESSKKFIDRCRKDGQVELNVITGDVANTEFGKFGSLVFELFYRVDLSTMS